MATPEYFKGQSLLEISLETGYDLTTVDVKKILFKKPSEAEGEYTTNITAVAGENPAVLSKVKYEFQAGDIDEDGTWEFRSYIEVAGRTAEGQPFKVLFGESIKQ
jgi:hypothetical protein